jgi:hypothetical protein
LGIAHETVLFAWPLAMRLALQLDENAIVDELVTLLDGTPVGHLPPLLRAERALVRARRLAEAGDPSAEGALTAVLAEFRVVASPYHLAHALLDHADFLFARGRSSEAEPLRDEAREIGERLRARQLIERADAFVAERVD